MGAVWVLLVGMVVSEQKIWKSSRGGDRPIFDGVGFDETKTTD